MDTATIQRNDVRVEGAVYATALAGLAVLAYLILADVGGRQGLDDRRPPIATVEQVENSVRSRPAALPSWDEIGLGHPLRQLDQVFTAEKAQALLALKDGTRITVQENTLVVLEMESESPALNIRRGILYIVSSQSGDDVVFKVNGVRGRVKSGSSEAVINVGRDGTADVIVIKGQATLDTPDGNREVLAKHVSRVTSDGKVSDSAAMSLLLAEPKWNAEVFVRPGDATSFGWIVQGEVGALTLEFARDSTFEDVVRVQPVTGTTAEVKDPPPGRYYWRVVETRPGDGSRQPSDVRQINFVPAIPPRMLRPSADEAFTYLPTATASGLRARAKVVVDWVPATTSSETEIEVVRSDTNAVVRSSRTSRPPYIDDGFADGSYRVRLRTHFASGKETEWSQPVTFTVAPLPDPVAPEVSGPEDGSSIRLDSGDVVLKATGSDIRSVEFEVSDSAQFATQVDRLNGSGLKATWKPQGPGTYFWRTRATDVFGRLGPYSTPRRLDVINKPSLMPPKLEQKDIDLEWGEQQGFWQRLQRWLLPVAYAADSARARVTWPVVEGAATYRLQIARDETFATTLVDEQVSKATYDWKNPEPGRYFYRVAALDESGASSVFSEAAPLNVNVPPPVLSGPGDNAKVNQEKAVEFSWKAAPTISSFRVDVARDPQFAKIIAQNTSPHGKLKIKMTVGTFHWRVVALGSDGATMATSKTRRLTVEGKPAASEVPPEPQVTEPIPEAPPTGESSLSPDALLATGPRDGLNFVALGYALASLAYEYESSQASRQLNGTASHGTIIEGQGWASPWFGVGVRLRGHTVPLQDDTSTSWSGVLDVGPRFGMLDLDGFYLNPYIGYANSELLYFERGIDANETMTMKSRIGATALGLRVIWSREQVTIRLTGDSQQALPNGDVKLGKAQQMSTTGLVQYRIADRLTIGLIYALAYSRFLGVQSTDSTALETASIEETVHYTGGLVGWLL